MERISATDRRIQGLISLLPQAKAGDVGVSPVDAIDGQGPGEQERQHVMEDAKRQGYAEGLKHALEEVSEATAKARHEIESSHAEEGLRLRADRDRLAVLLREIPAALAAVDTKVEFTVLEVTYAAVLRVIGQVVPDDMLVKKICMQALDEYRVRPAVLRLSPEDALLVAGSLDDASVRIVADHSLRRGQCRLETHKGQYDTDLALRLEALKQVFLHGIPHPEMPG
jgi:flagellar biosynthesis/type III secretory pathway protein FliH